LLRPLPFANSNELAWLDSNRGLGGLSSLTYKIDVYDEYAQAKPFFQQITAYMPFFGSGGYSSPAKGSLARSPASWWTQNFFQTLGVKPLYGRAFLPRRKPPKAPPMSPFSITHSGASMFNSDRSVLNTVVTINRQPYTVDRYSPAFIRLRSRIRSGQRIELFEPYPWDDIRQWGNPFSSLGRLKPGATIQSVQSEVRFCLCRKCVPPQRLVQRLSPLAFPV